MDSDLPYECNGCERTFAQINALSNHQRTCKKSKTRLSSALASARENWVRLKKARISGSSEGLLSTPSSVLSSACPPAPHSELDATRDEAGLPDSDSSLPPALTATPESIEGKEARVIILST